jgi:hypothetical protein
LKVEFEMLRKDAVVYTELREVTGY